MNNKRVIVAEDDASTSVLLREFLISKGYAVDMAKNGREALELYSANQAEVVITDIEMPLMDGNELIDKLKSFDPAPVIFVTTSHRNPDLIINIMKKGIYDYIIKPVDMNDLVLKLMRAFEVAAMKRSLAIAEKEKVIRLQNNLQWYALQEKMNSQSLKSAGPDIFESLYSTFNQGAGFGTLITLTSIITESAVKDGEDYRIDGQLFEVVQTNVRFAEKALDTFAGISRIARMDMNPEKISVAALFDDTTALISSMSKMIEIRKHHVIVSDKKEQFKNSHITISREYLLKAIEEIIINALKFSPDESDILVMPQIHDSTFTLSVINDIPATSRLKGIPMGYENLVFEPFYRLDKTVHEPYKSLDYGLGLALVERIATRLGGKASIHNINDYSDLKSGHKVKVEFTLTFDTTN